MCILTSLCAVLFNLLICDTEINESINQYCTVRSWYMRKRIDHWCSVVPEKFQPSGPLFSGKLGKPRCHWNGGPSGWDFSVTTEHQ